MTSRIVAVFLGLAALGGTGRLAAAQSVRSYVSLDSITVGDRFQLVVAAEHAGREQVILPGMPGSSLPTPSQIGELHVLGVASRGTRSVPGQDLVADSILFDVTTFGIDTVYVPRLPVLFAAGQDTARFFTAGFEFPVYSLIEEGRDDIEDLTPIADFPTPLWPWIGGGLVLLGAAIAAVALIRRRRTIVLDPGGFAVRPSPIEEARARLARLRSVPVDKDAEVKPFFVELSDTLRTYLGRRLHASALESTTAELILELELLNLAFLDGAVLREVERLLSEADLVKFADQLRPAGSCRVSLTDAAALIESIERSLMAGLEEGEGLEIAGTPEPAQEEPGADAEPDSPPETDSEGREEDGETIAGGSEEASGAEHVSGIDETDAEESKYLPGGGKTQR